MVVGYNARCSNSLSGNMSHSIFVRFGRASMLVALLAAGAVHAASCPSHYLDGVVPEIRNQKLAAATRELCFDEFGVMHSGVTRTALWSAEHLSRSQLEAAEGLERDNRFHAEPRLPRSQRAELSDYARSGLDRGHLAPNGNMPDRRAQRESFSLANMVPQDRDHNRYIWAPIEGAVRKMARREEALYVITGPAFLGSSLRKIGNVIVPSHLYKVVYSPRQKAAAAWFVENRADAPILVVPVAELERIIGITLLPSLTQRQKERMLALPAIRQGKRRYQN
jgi:endonuclease G, mitochondrial